MRKLLIIGAALLAAHSNAVTANTNGLKNPVNPLAAAGSFEVVNKWAANDSYIWCEAAKEARRMGASYQAKIYILNSLGPSLTSPGDFGVGFTLQPDADLTAIINAKGNANSASLTQIGNSMSVTEGQRRCVREIDN